MRLAILLQELRKQTGRRGLGRNHLWYGTSEYSLQIQRQWHFTAKEGNAEEIWVLGSGEYDVVAYAPFSGTSGEEQPVLEVTTASDNQATAKETCEDRLSFCQRKATSSNP